MNIFARIRSGIWDATTRIVADTIALLSPSRANQYRRDRELYKRAYIAANTSGPYSAATRPKATSGDAEVLSAQKYVTPRVRDMARNNPLVAGLEQKIPTMVIGDEIGFKAQVLTQQQTPDAALNTEIERRFYRWADAACADGSSLTDAMHLVESHLLIDGEVLVRDVIDKTMPGNPYRIQVLETDYLDKTKGLNGGGIDYTQAGKPKTFWVYDSHPGDGGSPKSSPVSADDIVLLADTKRSSQKRGISPLAPSVFKLWGVDDLEDAELVSSRSSCAFGIAIYSDFPESVEIDTDRQENDPDERIRSGGVLRLKNGERVESFKSERPNSNFEAFIRGRERKAAGATGISYETATGDYSQVNYSSARMGKIVEWANIRRRQYRIRRLLNMIYRKWLNKEITASGLPIKGLNVAAYNKDPQPFEACSWQLAGNEGIDIQKEINAFETEVAMGVNSRTRWCAERGRDHKEIAKELAEEKAGMKALGIYQEDPSVTTTSVKVVNDMGAQTGDTGTAEPGDPNAPAEGAAA